MENVRLCLSLRDKIDCIFKDKKKLFALVLLLAVGLVLIILPSAKVEQTEQLGQTLEEYKACLEAELASICSSVEGVGECRVMISFERGAENTYKGSALIESKPPKVMGVGIVCAGGERAEVRSELCSLVTSLFGIGANRVSVAELKK